MISICLISSSVTSIRNITKHKRYKELADYDKKNAFDVEKYLNHNLTFSKDTEFEMFRIDVTEDEIRQIEIIN